jgi:hypothetical protein
MLRLAMVALLGMGCSSGPAASPTAERVVGTATGGWTVPVHTCLGGGEAHTDVRDDGSVVQSCHRSGTLDGRFVQWHANGQKAAEGRYVDGQRDGAWAWWHPSGKLAARGRFSHGSEVGIWNWWHPNGQTETRGDHVGGRRAGLWQSWYPTGAVRAEGHYRNGSKDGAWKYWTQEGEPEKTETYELGRLLNETLHPAGRRKLREQRRREARGG